MNRKPFLVALSELIVAYWPRLSPNWRRRWRRFLPTPGNVFFTLLAIATLLWAQTAGAIPLQSVATASSGTIAYQGRLADSAGDPIVADTFPMVFRLYASASVDASPLWTEHWTSANEVEVSDGLFNVMLGSLTPIPQSVITGNDTLFLGISVGSDEEMTPRMQLGSVPFAVQALTVPDGSITATKLAAGSVSVSTLAPDVLGRFATEMADIQASYYPAEKTYEAQSVAATGYVDLLEIPITVDEASVLRISFHSLVWKTGSAGRTALGIRIDGAPNANPNNASWVQAGTPVSPGWTFDSQVLAGAWFTTVPAGAHTITLVLGSWDSGTSHAQAHRMYVEVLRQ